MTQSPVLPSQPLLQQNSECGPSRSTLGSGLLGVPGQGRCKREGAGEDLGPWGPSTGSLVPTRSLSHPVSKQMKKVGGWTRAKDKKKPRDSETQDQKAGRTPASSSGQTAADMGSKHPVPSSLLGQE